MTNEFNIGFIAPLSGPNTDIGLGLISSLEYAVNLNQPELSDAGISLNIKTYDDQNNPVLSEECARRASEDKCVLVIGPADSACASHVLNCEEFSDIPFLLSFATDVTDKFREKNNVFRTTTPGWRRSEILLRQIKDECTGQKLLIAGLAGLETSFAQRTKATVVEFCRTDVIDFVKFDFHCGPGGVTEIIPAEIPAEAPVIICSPSYEANVFVKSIRTAGHKGKLYSFGSNSNWLKQTSAGITLVCDLDRHDKNPVVADMLQNFWKTYANVTNPSIATMLAAKIMTQLLITVIHEKTSTKTKFVRKRLKALLSERTFEGVFGRVSFDSDGEMVGYETISMLRVMKRWRTTSFIDASTKTAGFSVIHMNTKHTISHTIQLVGAIAGIISLIVFFVS